MKLFSDNHLNLASLVGDLALEEVDSFRRWTIQDRFKLTQAILEASLEGDIDQGGDELLNQNQLPSFDRTPHIGRGEGVGGR